MAKKAKKGGSAAYFDALQKIFELQSGVLTAVLPHAGERGANDEERCRAFLAQVLPRQYSIGSGFVISSDTQKLPSRQQDVVIFDEFRNSPLHRELSAFVFPVEMVYATVEVKKTLRSKDVTPIVRSIESVRQLSMQCHYAFPVLPDKIKPEHVNMPGRFRLGSVTMKQPPKGFAFAFDADYGTADGLKTALEDALNNSKAHLHGLVVVKKDWFFYQKAYTTPAKIEMFTGNALLRFVNNMLVLLKTHVIREADMSRYLDIPTAPLEPAQPVQKVEPKAAG